MKTPSDKTIEVIEWFANSAGTKTNLKELSAKTHIPAASLLRILNSLTVKGYVLKDESKRYFSLFSLSKPEQISELNVERIEKLMRDLSVKCGQTVELLTVRNNELLWLKKIEVQDLPIKIVAHEGFVRTLYELDAPSRAYLGHAGIEFIKKKFDISSFYGSTGNHTRFNWKIAEKLITTAKMSTVAYDPDGNSRSVRRYAAVLLSSKGEFRYVLTIAEPALKSNSNEKHYKMQIDYLKKTVDIINNNKFIGG
jgi:DNA-binding IclR family transcriptional regulator